MMKKIFPLVYLCAWLVLSCETTVDVDIPRDDDRLVINAILEADSSVRLNLSSSRFSLDNDPIMPVERAEVTLYEDGQAVAVLTEAGAEINGNRGWYESNYKVRAGHRYTIRAAKEGFQSVEAETFIAEPVSISDLDYDYLVLDQVVIIDGVPDTFQQKELQNISLVIDDPSGEDNYYEVIMYQEATQYLRDFSGTEPIVYDSIRRLYETYLSSDDPLVTDEQFFESDASFYGNSLIFSDETFEGKNYRVEFRHQGSSGFSEDGSLKYLVFLKNLNREQYLYIRSLQLQRDTEGNPFAEPVPVYSNVVGGYGIFTGFSHDTSIIELED
jgi:hypothetical protein